MAESTNHESRSLAISSSDSRAGASGTEGEIVALRPEPGVSASLGAVPIATAIELAHGDVVRVSGDPPRELRVAD
jgi:hypothetical protein